LLACCVDELAAHLTAFAAKRLAAASRIAGSGRFAIPFVIGFARFGDGHASRLIPAFGAGEIMRVVLA
jgi:hypothetical protein